MTSDTNRNKAVIWDMDGVIADTAPYHFRAWQESFNKRGIEFTEADFRRGFGQRNDNIIRGVLGQQTTEAEIADISPEKEAVYRRLAAGKQQAHPGAVALLGQLRDDGYKIALASSAPPENIRFVLDDLGIGEYFQAVVSGRDVTRGKPDPQVFLLAAERLGINPVDCVVIEDAVAGVAAAKQAGMTCIAVTNTNSRESLHQADLIVDSLEQVTVNDVDKLTDDIMKGS